MADKTSSHFNVKCKLSGFISCMAKYAKDFNYFWGGVTHELFIFQRRVRATAMLSKM